MADVVHLSYLVTDGMDEATVAAVASGLSADERARQGRLHFWRDRRDFALAHMLLRQSLSALDDRPPDQWTFVADTHGKPLLTLDDATRTRLTFNLSHTNGLVSCAVGRVVDIGVDVEEIGRVDDESALADRFFSRREAEALAACDRTERSARFTEIWTLKEAFIKATGEGLSCPLDRFWFAFDDEASLAFGSDVPTGRGWWRFELFAPTPQHRMAVAIRSHTTRPPGVVIRVQPIGGDAAMPLLPLRTAVAMPSSPSL